MTDLKPTFLFHYIDPVFLKLGKPLARHIAKKDETDDILFKRENQSKLIVSTAIKMMQRSTDFIKYFLLFASFIVSGAIMSSVATNILLEESLIRIYFFQYAVDISLVIPYFMMVVQAHLKQNERDRITREFYRRNAVYVLKHSSYRIHQFYKKILDFKTPPTPVHHIFSLGLISITMINHQPLLITTRIAIAIYPVISLIIFANWCFNYLVAAIVYHSDDFGKKEKKTSKEKKSVMVPDAV